MLRNCFFARLSCGLLTLGAAGGGCHLPESPPARTALDDYVAEEDPSYSWKLVKTIPGDGFRAYVIDMISQTWRSPSEVDRSLWQHWLTIIKPDRVESKTALLVIGGGRNGGGAPERADAALSGIAVSNRSVVAALGMVPNQPLVFSDDNKERLEDDLVAHTWNKFMETGDPTWLARMPMVKSAVRAMDTAQAFTKSQEGGALAIERFVVAGGSKRGWTTWLTGAVDRRVASIVPIVIDVLNVNPSMEHHYAAYGFWAPAIRDYENNGIMEKRRTPEFRRLLDLVDPYEYRHRLAMPKFIINAAGDQFFLPDSSRFYFDDLIGQKHLRYVPNADHGLDDSDALQSLEAYYRAIVDDTRLPRFVWTLEDDGSIRVRAIDEPLEARLWQASNPDARDFRLETIGKSWRSEVLEAVNDRGESTYVGGIETPQKGWTAFFIELTYGGIGPNPLKFTTQVRVIPEVLPFAGVLDARERTRASGRR